MTAVTISREKLAPVPGTNYRFAWKWIYRVAVPGHVHTYAGETLAWARDLARRKAPGIEVIETWRIA